MPYYGRGGAGNIEAVQKENERINSDVEASQSAAERATSDFVPPADIKREEQQYAHSGRGGMGNWFSPAELNQSGKFSDAHRSHIPGDGTLSPDGNAKTGEGAPPSYNAIGASVSATEGVKKYGRGGAGNYDFGINEAEQKAARRIKTEDEKKARLEEDIEKGVQETLAMPQKAKLPGAEPY